MNKAVREMTPFLVMDVLEKAKTLEAKGVDVVHLEIGEPDSDVHPFVVDAIKRAYDEHRTHYTDSFGDVELREAVCRLYKAEYGVDVTPDRVLVTSGSSPALLLALQVLCDVGDEVLVSNPGYPCYRDFALACHATPREVPVSAENGFQFDAKDVAAALTPKAKAVFVNSPMNPAGTLAEPESLKRIVDLCAANGTTVLSDEIYHGLVYNGKKPHSILEFTDDAYVFNGFSKRFDMTGLRLGYLIAPKKHLRVLRILQQNLFICAGSIAQRAGLEAINLQLGSTAKAREFQRFQAAKCAEYDTRRRFMLDRLKDLGFEVKVEPEGAFYVFADARRYTKDSLKFAFDVLNRAHVGITPGTDFGSRGQGFIRLSYATDVPRLREAFNRLAEF